MNTNQILTWKYKLNNQRLLYRILRLSAPWEECYYRSIKFLIKYSIVNVMIIAIILITRTVFFITN
jgi:hypothetical protein